MADEPNPLGIRLYGSFLHTDQVPNALFFFSDIEENDSFELRKAIRNHNIDTVVLSSRGGSVLEGLNMAGIIFDKGLKTYVPEQGIGDEGNCASACSFMFFGGSTRIADGKLGVHQFYSGASEESAEIGETQRRAQFTVSEIIGFLNEFSTPPFVFERMFQQQNMYYFNKTELEEITRTEDPIAGDDVEEIKGFIRDFNIELAKLRLEEEQKIAELPKPKFEDEVAPGLQSEPNSPAPSKVEPVDDTVLESPIPRTGLAEPAEVQPPTIPTNEPADLQITVESEKQLIKSVQTKLNLLKCNAGVVDGIWGAKSKQALKRLVNELPNRTTIDSLTYKNADDILADLPGNVRCKESVTGHNKATLLSGNYIHETTCNGRKRFHIVTLKSPNIAGQNKRTIPRNVSHSFDIGIKGTFAKGYYGLSNSPLGHWSFSGWVYLENSGVRFEANPYATQYSKTKAENNINATYKVASDRKSYTGVDKIGCKVFGSKIRG